MPSKLIMPAMSGFTFGADPELFIVDENGKHVSAEGLIPGTKAEPHVVEGGAVQVDGMAAEFNIDPCSDFETFNNNVTGVMKQLKEMLPKGYNFSIIPAVEFSADVFDSAPDCAKELGCSPDYNAWTGELNPPPSLENRPRLRCAGGHIHFGWTADADLSDLQHLMNCRDLVKQLDWYLAGWSIGVDPDPTRRMLYGRAGACRIKPYGVEYRVLSNFWLTSKERRLQVWNRMQMALKDMRKQYIPDLYPNYNELLVEGINTSKLNAGLVAAVPYPLRRVTTSLSY